MTYEAKNSTKGTLQKVHDQVERHESLINILIIVLFVGFAAAFIAVGGYVMQYEANKQATYQNLVDKINKQDNNYEDILDQLRIIESKQVGKLTCKYEKGGLSCQP